MGIYIKAFDRSFILHLFIIMATYPVIKGFIVSSKKEEYSWNTADSLGRGAGAIVYLGRYQKTGEVVAVKVFHKHLPIQESMNELELLRKLKHPNIIRFLDGDEAGDQLVMIMEYCEGGSLHHMLNQPSYSYGLPEEEYLLVLQHVSNGIRYLRRENIVHRDIKPANIMHFITHYGISMYKLTDFGAARNLCDDETFQSLCGTEEYLHPGVYEKAILKLPINQSFDSKSDLWSLGVTFYQTATGRLPFIPYGGVRNDRETMFEIISQKESGVISGIQHSDKEAIEWSRDLPDTCLLSMGLRGLIIPLLAGLMEPDIARMISYEIFFRTVDRLVEKVKICFFYFSHCEEMTLYIDPTIKLAGLQDFIASCTDITASDQILLVQGKSLEELVDPFKPVSQYPLEILEGPIFLFDDGDDNIPFKAPNVPSFPNKVTFVDTEKDSHNVDQCCAIAELIKHRTEMATRLQKHLIQGILGFKIYVESRLVATRISHNLTKQSVNMFKNSLTLTTNAGVMEDIRATHHNSNERLRMIEEIYLKNSIEKLEEVKSISLQSICKKEKCCARTKHHLSTIYAAQNRFHRDKNHKHEMSVYDYHIHEYEKQKLEMNCSAIEAIIKDHCFNHLSNLFENCKKIYKDLNDCLDQLNKIEFNISRIFTCNNSLSKKMVGLRQDFTATTQNHAKILVDKLNDIEKLCKETTELMLVGRELQIATSSIIDANV